MNEVKEEMEETESTIDSDPKSPITSLNVSEKLSCMPEVLNYIQSLERIIAKHEKKIKKLQRRLKKKEMKDVGIQTNETPPKGLTEEITEAAQSAMTKSGFVYEETSGLYYDYNSGYYYNAEYGLYYDGNTGTYMSYDNEKQEYIFHSQVQPQRNHENVDSNHEGREGNKRGKNQRKIQEQKKIKKHDQRNAEEVDLEEGECSDFSETKESGSESDIENIDITQSFPPCIRIIIEDTSIPSIKPGSLHIITYDGGTLGREGKHDILLPDINVSKHHLQFKYDKDHDKYFVTDLGSRNGTLLNGKRMSASKQESTPIEIVHGSKIQIGTTTMTCHVHKGSQTCGMCEPGLIQKNSESKGVVNSDDKMNLHKMELRNLKRKFAVGRMGKDCNLGAGYTDRAQVRRETVGSQNENEKTQMASVDQSISSENRGFKLLSKMGWSEGQSLGKDGTGRIEPVELISNPGTAGMGSTESSIPVVSKGEKSDKWGKARERYQQLTD